MRPIKTKYPGECRKCAASLPVGADVVYERRVGVFCPGCAPTDPEEVRKFRQEAADRKADRYDEWAGKREEKADRVLNSNPEIRHDIAFNTQPGHIPFRARMIAADDRALESLAVARGFRAKADRLRKVRVAGDAETARQARREAVLVWLKVGMAVDTCHYGRGIVKKINRKTATISNTGSSGTFTVAVDLSFLSPVTP